MNEQTKERTLLLTTSFVCALFVLMGLTALVWLFAELYEGIKERREPVKFRPVYQSAGNELPINDGMFPLSDVVIKDGDTIRADILLPWGVVLNDQDIRAADYDAWELSRHRRTVDVTDEEIVKGRKAKARLQRFDVLAISPAGEERDNYGRLLGILFYREQYKWKRVGALMDEEGHTRR